MKHEWYGQQCLPSRAPRPRIAGKRNTRVIRTGEYPFSGNHAEGKRRPYTCGERRAVVPQGGDHVVPSFGAGPSVGHPLLCETTTLRAVPAANSSEWTPTWSSCVGHSTKAARIAPGGFPSIQSRPVWSNSLEYMNIPLCYPVRSPEVEYLNTP